MSSDGPPPVHATDPITAPASVPNRALYHRPDKHENSRVRMHQHHKPTAKRLTTSCRIELPPRIKGPTLTAAGDKKVAPERASDDEDSTPFTAMKTRNGDVSCSCAGFQRRSDSSSFQSSLLIFPHLVSTVGWRRSCSGHATSTCLGLGP